MNQLERQCGNLRGASKMKLMICELVLNSIPFISEGMQDIVTKSRLPRRGKRTAPAFASNNDAVINLKEDDDDVLGGEGELFEVHRQMNDKGLLRGPSDVNNKLFDFFNTVTVYAQNAYKDIAREADVPQNVTLTKQALGLK